MPGIVITLFTVFDLVLVPLLVLLPVAIIVLLKVHLDCLFPLQLLFLLSMAFVFTKGRVTNLLSLSNRRRLDLTIGTHDFFLGLHASTDSGHGPVTLPSLAKFERRSSNLLELIRGFGIDFWNDLGHGFKVIIF